MLNSKYSKVTVIVHEASATGAPILLLNLLSLMKNEWECDFFIILLRGGQLEDSFHSLGNVLIIKPADYSTKKFFPKLYYLFRSRWRLLISIRRSNNTAFILNNSMINGWAVNWLRFSKKPIVTYVHELSYVAHLYSMKRNVIPVLNESQIFLYPCEKVKEYLLSLGVQNQLLYRLNYFFNLDHFNEHKIFEVSGAHQELRICAVGMASYRKGTDLFIEIANKVVRGHPNIFFTWIGGFASPKDEKNYLSSIDMNCRSNIEFTGLLPPEQVKNLYANYDILLLTSREDPYPLVVLEAAAHKIPSIVFRDSGGISDFVDEKTGFLFDMSDTDRLAAFIPGLTHENLYQKGHNAYDRFLEMHTKKNVILHQLDAALSTIK
ncbi:MAG: glycosyltransferase family 4 protein [Bacteroidota bacterium]